MYKKVKEIADIYYGRDYKKNPKGEGIPIYGTGGLMGYTSIPLNIGPAILSGRKGSINNPQYIEGEFWNVDTIFCIKPKHGYHAKWLYYNFLNSDLSALNEATGVPSVTSKSLYNLRFKYFEYPQQSKIAEVISQIDNVIEKTQQAIAKYKCIKQGMLHDLFTRGIGADGKLRPTVQQAPELYKPSALGMIPKEWEVNELQHYLSYISYGFTNPMPTTEDGPFMVTAANINDGIIQLTTCRRTSQKAFDTLLTNKSKPIYNDILLTKDGTLGRLAIVETNNICINQSVAVLRPKSNVNPYYLKTLLETRDYQKKMLDDAGGSTIKHIYITVVDKMLIGVPIDLEEQSLIFQMVINIEKAMQQEEEYLGKLMSLKQGLMADLLTGKKEVIINEELVSEKAMMV
jgi:type I restriction enzyme S subunit